MAAPSITYTFTNGFTADAGQVNTNFSDLITALTGGNSDIYCSTLRLASYLNLNEGSGPGTPASGQLYLYGKTTKKVAVKNSDGIETEIGASSGAGRVNYIDYSDKAWNFDSDLTGWNTYKDAAATTPADGTGGTSTLTLSRVTSSPLNGEGMMRIAKPASNVQGEGVSVDLNIPPGYQFAQQSGVWLLINTDTANYTAGDWVIYLRDLTNSVNITPRAVAIPKMKGPFFVDFGQPATCAQIRLILHCASTGTTAYNIDIDDAIVGPGVNETVPTVIHHGSFTPVYTNQGTATFTVNQAEYWQVGNKMSMRIRLVRTNAGSGSVAFRIDIPNNLTAALTPTTIESDYGSWSMYAGSTFDAGGMISVHSGYKSIVLIDNGTGDGLTGANIPAYLYIHVKDIPIAEWAGSSYAGSNQVEYASVGGTWDADGSTTVYGPQGSAMGGSLSAARTKTITWQYPPQAGDRIQVWASEDQVNWFPINGATVGSTPTVIALGFDSSGSFASGVRWKKGSSANQTQVIFAVNANIANDDSPTTAWPSSSAYWVVTKSAPGSVLFGAATATQMGLVSAEESGSFTATFTQSGGYSQAVSVKYHRVGKMVTLRFPSFAATATATAGINVTAGTIPASLRPDTSTYWPVFVRDNGADLAAPGYLGVFADGAISLGKSWTSSNFTSGASAGLMTNTNTLRTTVSYLID